MNLQESARDLLDRYLHRLRLSLRTEPGIDVGEVEDDVRAHVYAALDEADEPVGAPVMERILERMGPPRAWLGEAGGEARRGSDVPTAQRRDALYLAFVSLALLLAALALPPFLWIGVFGAFLTARASIGAAQREPHGAGLGLQWLRSPSLLLVYVPLMMLLLLWPAIAVRLAADFVVDHPAFALRLPAELAWLAERIAAIRLSHFDPWTTLQNAVRSGHWLLFPVGVWLVVLGGLVRLAPRCSAALFRPFVDRNARALAHMLLFCGLLLATSAIGLAVLKHLLVHGSVH